MKLKILTYATTIASRSPSARAQPPRRPRRLKRRPPPRRPDAGCRRDARAFDRRHEYAPLIEQKIDYKDWTFKSLKMARPSICANGRRARSS